jgi:dCMP deaminase
VSKQDDLFFLGMAQYVASRSKDPSTKVGAVVVRPNRTVASVGYNGFPRGVCDDPARYSDRPTKYLMVCHAEQNALHSASDDVSGSTLYCTLHPCAQCAGSIIQRGVARVVCFDSHNERLADHFAAAKTMFREADVQLDVYSGFRLKVEPTVKLVSDPIREPDQLALL